MRGLRIFSCVCIQLGKPNLNDNLSTSLQRHPSELAKSIMLVKENIWCVNYNTTQFRSKLTRFHLPSRSSPWFPKEFPLKEKQQNIVQPVQWLLNANPVILRRSVCHPITNFLSITSWCIRYVICEFLRGGTDFDPELLILFCPFLGCFNVVVMMYKNDKNDKILISIGFPTCKLVLFSRLLTTDFFSFCWLVLFNGTMLNWVNDFSTENKTCLFQKLHSCHLHCSSWILSMSILLT